ncbi:MAG: hypothetical protein ACRC9L_00720, partial [Brevinema sp.]
YEDEDYEDEDYEDADDYEDEGYDDERSKNKQITVIITGVVVCSLLSIGIVFGLMNYLDTQSLGTNGNNIAETTETTKTIETIDGKTDDNTIDTAVLGSIIINPNTNTGTNESTDTNTPSDTTDVDDTDVDDTDVGDTDVDNAEGDVVGEAVGDVASDVEGNAVGEAVGDVVEVEGTATNTESLEDRVTRLEKELSDAKSALSASQAREAQLQSQLSASKENNK